MNGVGDRVVVRPQASPRTGSAIVRWWDRLFGPPRWHLHPDGSAEVRLLGRRFEARSPGALFDLVAKERERLLVHVGRMHEGAATRPMIAGARFADTYHLQTRRIEDRIALYTAFLGRMSKDLGIE
jgi:hypothetical protein